MTFHQHGLSPSNSTADSGLSQQLQQPIMASRLLFAFITLVIISLVTRVYTGISIKKLKASPENATELIPFYPYWLPIVGHIPSFVYDGAALLDRARKSTSHGIFALNLGGTTQSVIATPALSNELFRKKSSEVGQWEMAWVVMKNVRHNTHITIFLDALVSMVHLPLMGRKTTNFMIYKDKAYHKLLDLCEAQSFDI